MMPLLSRCYFCHRWFSPLFNRKACALHDEAWVCSEFCWDGASAEWGDSS